MRNVRRTDHGRRRVTRPAASPVLEQVDAAAMTGGAASPPAVSVMPLAEVLVYPSPSQAGYVTVAYRGLSPIFTADGAAVPGRAPGRWAQLRAAGRP